jgi:hypothetical protein
LVERDLPPICIDVMRDKVGYNRGDKLSKWMKVNYSESYDYTLDKPELINTNISYVILDDSYLSDYQYKQKDHIVEVATYKCLTYENALQAIEILKGEYLMLTGDLNMADMEFIVQYDIKDAVKYLFNAREPKETIRENPHCTGFRY